MTNNSKTKVIALGLNFIERETLQSVFCLSDRYCLIPIEDAISADIVLVNIDDPDTLLYWKSTIDRPGLATVVVAEHAGRYGEVVYLERRFARRRCFAKQLLAVVDKVAPARAAAPVPQAPRTSASAMALLDGVLRLAVIKLKGKYQTINTAMAVYLANLNRQIEASVATFQAEFVNAAHRDEIATRRQIDI